ncbi:MAG: polysaccharide biosynthesis C-terminal domain-containing protein [Thermoleophilaceae bacterium]|nr:polysaccharide biosynthesis C-terminal domain-containing protein [Thermoleophilaceae bacterium]
MPDLPPNAVKVDGPAVDTPAEATEERENIGAKIVRGGVWRLIAYGFATAVAVVSTSVVSRAIGPVDFAVYTTVISLVSVGLGLSDFGLLALGMRDFAALEGAERERNMCALITLRILFSLVATAGIIAFGLLAGYPSGTMAGLIAASIGLCVVALYTSYCVPLQATYRFTELALLDATRQGIWSGLMILAAVISGSVGLVIGALLPAAIVVTIAAALLVRRITTITPTWDPATMRSLLSSVGAFAVAASVGAAYVYLAQVASDLVLNGYESGQLALAFRVFAVTLAAGIIAILGAFPLLVVSARDDLERLIYATRRIMQTAVLVGLACAIGLLNGAEFVVAILGGPKYQDAIQMLAIIGFALPASYLLNSGSTVLLAAGRHRELVVVSVIGAALSIGVTAALASAYGGEGAAAGIVVGEVLLAAGYLSVVARIDRQALPGLKWAGFVLLAGSAGCAVVLIGLPAVPSAILGIAVYGGIVLAFGALPPEIHARIPVLGRNVTID